MRSYAREGIAGKVRALGGEIYAISSEPQALADRAAADWQLDFQTVGDPHHEITGACRERGWVDLFVNERLEFLQANPPSAGWVPSHPKGYLQPGVLALGADGRVLYRWRSVPSRRNVGGAAERPTATHVWDRVARALESGAAAGDAPLDADPPLDARGLPWPLFVCLLLANGWFVKPRAFRALRHVARAGLRLVAFAIAWILAFVWLPTLPVAVALAAWIAWVVPQARWVGREFQNAAGG